jgi:hypothetical protein
VVYVRRVPLQFRVQRKPKPTKILLIWFNEDVLRERPGQFSHPLTQFDEFLCRTRLAKSVSSSSVSILGPQLSTTLKAMIEEVNTKYPDSSTVLQVDGASQSWSKCFDQPNFYVYGATADDAMLIPKSRYFVPDKLCLPCLENFFDDKHTKLHRMIAPDEVLALAIRDELKKRNITNGRNRHSHIALISEMDTLYGRTLPDSMARCLGEGEHGQCRQVDEDWLYRVKYLRGLDGQTGANSKDSAGEPNMDTSRDKDTKQSTNTQSAANSHDRAQGQGQFDYLRRLAETMQEYDTQLSRNNNHKGIEAIGVLGSDAYDKLLVMQALRPLFPDAVFFTNDLDAIVLHPTVLANTRNLLIASGFALGLRRDIQVG